MKLLRFLFFTLFLASTAQAFSVSPPTILQSWNDPLTINEQVSSATLNTGGQLRLKLTEAPESSANVQVTFLLEDGTTPVATLDFTNSDSTADVDVQVSVLSKKAVIYVTPLVTANYVAAVYGVGGGDTNATQTNASALTTGTLPEAQLGTYVVTTDYATHVDLDDATITSLDAQDFEAQTVSSDYVTANLILAKNVNVTILQKDFNQGLASGAETVVTFDNETVDYTNMHSNTEEPSRCTINVAGYYLIHAQVGLDSASAGGRRTVNILKNGSQISNTQESNPSSDYYVVLSTTAVVSLAVGDYVEVNVYQDSGSVMSALASTSTSYTKFEIVRLN